MTSSLLTWVGIAVLVFWSVGAYNRLVRLRAEVNVAFAQVDTQLQQQLRLVDALVSDDTPAAPELPPSWTGLEGASAQLAACLASARAKPLHPQRIAALAAAGDVLAMAWERVEREDAHDLAGPRLPEAVADTRTQLLVQAQAAVDAFNESVAHYNTAIAQFPAVLLAWVFGFQRGQGL